MSNGNQKETLGKVLHYLKPYRLRLGLSLILAAATVVLTLYLPILIGRSVDVIGRITDADSGRDLLSLFSLMAVAAGVNTVLQWFFDLSNKSICYHVVRDIREQAFMKIKTLPFSYLDSHSHGEILSRVITDVDQFADGLLLGLPQVFTGVITIFGTLLFMLSVNGPITAVVVFLTPVSLLVSRLIASRSFRMFRLQSEARGEQTALVNEMVGGRKVVRAFGQEDRVQKQFDEMNERLGRYSLRAIFYSSLTNPGTRFVNNLVYAGVGLTGALYALAGGLTVGQLTVFLSYANQYTKPFNEISEVIAELQNALACAARVFELLEEEGETPDRPNAVEINNVAGNVELKQVSFSYRSEQKLIENLNLQVTAGQRIAIVGPTGCGKTTLINLLMRFYDVDGGRIMVEGQDIRDLSRSSLRRSFGMVLQETWLRSGTVWDNITLGKRDATRDEVWAAARAAHAHGFIMQLPQGYETEIGEDGGSLSQGQKQLLCITRIMLRLPPILILDEATSSIDTRTEMRISRDFTAMMAGRTSFIVAHRLSTIRGADVILVMKDGQVIEQGRHNELLDAGGFYRELYYSQYNYQTP